MSSKKLVKIVLGTHTVGDISKGEGVTHFDDPTDVQDLLDAFFNRGYRDLDTARNYSFNAPGSSETRLGQVNAHSRFTIHTKVLSGPGAHEPSSIALSVEGSLQDLKTSTVETMFLHVPDRQIPFEDTAKAMDEAWRAGKFKKFGLSNYTAAEVEQFINICKDKGFVQPSVYEGHYNAIVRGGEKELFPLLRKHSISFYAFSPAAGGLFSEHAGTAARWSNQTKMGQAYGFIYGQAPVRAAVTTVRDAAKKHGISGHAAAVRWTAFHGLLDGGYGDAIIFAVSKIEQLHGTLDALEAGPLPAELADAISAVYATVEGSEPAYHL